MEMMEARALLPLLVLLMQTCTRPAHAYKPVIIVHGLFDGPEQFRTLTQFIQKAHPGTPVFPLRVDSRGRSLRGMWLQVQDFRTEALRVMRAHPDGVHLLCFSQGGLVCRGLLATVPNHNVNTFISLSAPLAGQFGVTDYLKPLLGKRSDVFRFCYSRLGQAVSICDYWNDPHHRDLFLKHNGFLPLLNADVPHSRAAEWRENFLLLKKLVLIGGPDDGVITPWQSSLFGFYDSSEQVVEMRNQTFFLSDAFGLKTLWARGGVQTCVHNGVRHTEWHSNLTVFQSCMESLYQMRKTLSIDEEELQRKHSYTCTASHLSLDNRLDVSWRAQSSRPHRVQVLSGPLILMGAAVILLLVLWRRRRASPWKHGGSQQTVSSEDQTETE